MKTFVSALFLATALSLTAAAQDAASTLQSTTPSQDTTTPQDATAPLQIAPAQNPQDQQPATSQSPASTDQNTAPVDTSQEPVATFKVNVVGGTTKAINYHFRSGATKVDLAGTELAPRAHGTARVSSHLGRIEIDLSVAGLDPPQRFGTEYLTYVAWAITPQGRAQNLGEIILDGGKKIDVTTDLQAFGIIVTAEPYFAVTQPSNLVVLENRVRPDTVGASEYIDAKYELVKEHQYVPPRAKYEPETLDPKVPLALHEARNAVRIAQIAGADQYASDTFDRASQLLQQAEDYQARKKPELKPISTVAREAAQTAEDARLITLRKKQEQFDTAQREAAAKREADARQQAAEEAQRRAAAEQQAQLDAQRAQQAQQSSEEAQRQADEARRQQQEAEAARQAALQQQQQAQADSQRAQQAAQAAEHARQQAERDREELRQKLLQQFNTILETRDTARGLIVNMSDVLFDTGKYSLKPGAREKLAKLTGIVLAYPGLKLAVEGHTDNVGGDAYNQRLSEKRADTVKAYLISQGIAPDAVTSSGFGKTQPVASNATAAGRQQNRRVEIVVSGEVIGTQIGPTRTQQPGTTPQPNPNNPHQDPNNQSNPQPQSPVQQPSPTNPR